MIILNSACTLCYSENLQILNVNFKQRKYLLCHNCKLIMADTNTLPSPEQEIRRYSDHQNFSSDKGYSNFLYKIIQPVMDLLVGSEKGLDYGCGPNPVLSEIVRSKGYSCDVYDPFFFPHFPNYNYDFIFATECFEHFFYPTDDVQKVISLLNPGGILAVMTEIWYNLENFEKWYYIRDFTHVSFYHADTMKYLSDYYKMQIVFTDNKRIFIFRKN